MTRLPLELLHSACGTSSTQALASVVGVEARQVHRARREGLSQTTADRWAIAAGLHPAVVWGTAWWDTE